MLFEFCWPTKLMSGVEREGMCTLCLEGAQVLSEGVCWTPELQKSQVAMFSHLHLLLLLLPHSYYDLTPQRGR